MGYTMCVSHLAEKVEFEGRNSVVTVSGTMRWLGKKCLEVRTFFCLHRSGHLPILSL